LGRFAPTLVERAHEGDTMTARMLATLALALGLTAWSGCSTGKDTTADGTDGTTAGDDDDDDDNAEETAPTGTSGPEYFVPAAIQPLAYFGFDLTNGTLVTVHTSYGDIEPAIEVNIGNEDWLASNLDTQRTDLYCFVQLKLTDSTFAPWAQAAGLYYGVDYTGAEPPLTNCLAENGFEVDPGWTSGYGDGALATIFGLQWGVAVGPLTADGEAALAGYSYAGLPEGSFFGSVFYDPLLDTMVDGQLAYAEELDGTLTTTGNFLQASTVNPGNGIATGFYTAVALYYVYFQ
jgi:hypothetical protein